MSSELGHMYLPDFALAHPIPVEDRSAGCEDRIAFIVLDDGSRWALTAQQTVNIMAALGAALYLDEENREH